MTTTTVHNGTWSGVWRVGRLMDVYHAESDTPLDCVQVGDYDWQTGEHTNASREVAQEALDEWVKDHGDEYSRELPYLG